MRSGAIFTIFTDVKRLVILSRIAEKINIVNPAEPQRKYQASDDSGRKRHNDEIVFGTDQ